jgi:tetratricopeptide (TPR) repeat protein
MRLVAVILAAALSSASSDDRAMDLLRDWIKAVDGHSAGESDAALRTINDWTYNDLELMRPYVELLVDAPILRDDARGRRRSTIGMVDRALIRALTKDLTLRGDFDAFRKRAAILHTDSALSGSAPVVVPPPLSRQLQARRTRQQSNREVFVKSFDGRVQDFELKNPNWYLAMDMLDALPTSPARDPMVAGWYRAIGAYFARERRFADALAHFDRARQVVPDNADVLYGEACLHETLGAPRIQNYIRVTTLPNGLYIRGVESQSGEWRRAEGLLRRALTLNPAFPEARLRLAHVLIQLAKYEEGLALAEQVVAESNVATTRYYALLFAGDALLSLDRNARARASYERAIDLFPETQAARLGLASALRIGGETEKALEALLPTITKDPSERGGDDPWWAYYDGDATDVQALLDDLREPFTSPRR